MSETMTMHHCVTLSRALPMPTITAAGRPIDFRPVQSCADIPAGTQVHCVTSLDRLTRADIDAMPPSVRLIANAGVGINHVDLAAAQARGIAVTNTPVVTEDTADLAFALILAACRRVPAGERHLRNGQWAQAGAAPLGRRVHGKTLGLVGFGAIAQAVAQRARGFDMPVRYWNRTRRSEAEAALGATYVADLKALVASSDIISIHTALTPETAGLMDAAVLAAARPSAVLVNTARGDIVDEAALCEALEQGRLAAAGLDVFVGEPQVNARLLALDNVVLTPHIGSATDACMQDIVGRLLGNVVSFLETGLAPDVVKP